MKNSKGIKNNSFNKNTRYWLDSSEKDFQAAQSLLKSKHYSQCLFFCHLSVEKLLKGIVTQTIKDYPPFTHDLRKLARIAGLDLSPSQKKVLDKIFSFNIVGRYAGAKLEFYKKYNKKEYAQKYLKITQDLLLWLKKESPKK